VRKVFIPCSAELRAQVGYRLWHWTLTAPDARCGEQRLECEYYRIVFAYGNAGSMAARVNDVSPPAGSSFRIGLRASAILEECAGAMGCLTPVTNIWSQEVRSIITKWIRMNPEILDPQETYFWEGDHLHLKTKV
jgi:hypothetical protein